MLSVYTIRLWHKYTTRFSHDMFRPDGAIFRYIGVFTISCFLMLLSPTLASVHTLGVRGMYGLCLPFFCEIYCRVHPFSKGELHVQHSSAHAPLCVESCGRLNVACSVTWFFRIARYDCLLIKLFV
jgi:hypothetical protein